MSGMRTMLVALAVALAADGHAGCLDGDYAVVGEPLVPSPGATSTSDVVTIAGDTVAIASGCPAALARIRTTLRGTVVRVRWRACGAGGQPARLRAIVGPSCATMQGRFVTFRPRAVRRFIARHVGACVPGGIACPTTCERNADCAATDYCAKPPGACGGGGTCELRPTACTQELDRVCGCDGRTYPNRCDAAARGVSVAHAGPCDAVCGGFAGIPCAEGEYCELPKGECQGADLAGVCVPGPKACPDLRSPVCGCDGVTYGNECERMTAGVQLDHAGPCSAPCTSACDCETSLELPPWCATLLCPACGCGWVCADGRCDVHVESPPPSSCK